MKQLRSSACFLSRFPKKMEVSRGGVLFRWVLLQRKEEKDNLILDTCNSISVFYFLLHKEIVIERQEGHIGKKRVPSHQGFQNNRISGAGVLLGWVLLRKQEEKDTRNTLNILDAPL